MLLLVEEACCVLTWGVNVGGHTIPSSPGTFLILRLCRVVNPNEWNLYCNIWKVWPILQGHWLWTLKAVTCLTGIIFLLIVRLTVLQSIEAQQIKCDYSQLIIDFQNIFSFSSSNLQKKCSHGKQLIDAEMKCDSSQWTCPVAFEILEILLKKNCGRVAELGSLSSAAKMAMKIFVKRVFTIFVSNASFLRVIANLQN